MVRFFQFHSCSDVLSSAHDHRQLSHTISITKLSTSAPCVGCHQLSRRNHVACPSPAVGHLWACPPFHSLFLTHSYQCGGNLLVTHLSHLPIRLQSNNCGYSIKTSFCVYPMYGRGGRSCHADICQSPTFFLLSHCDLFIFCLECTVNCAPSGI